MGKEYIIKSPKVMFRIAYLAWKNIWRNKVRSGVILGAIAIGLFSGTFMLAFINGWVLGTVNSDIETQFAHVQVCDNDFRANYDINNYFFRDEVVSKIDRDLASNISVRTSFRLCLTGMLSSPYNAMGVTAKGVWPEEEKQVSTVWQQISDSLGSFLPDDTRTAIVISKKIAEKLNVKLKSKIIFTFQDIHGDMQSIAFRICGIYKTTNGMYDEANVLVRYDDLFEYTGLPVGAVHETGILLPDLTSCSNLSPQIKKMFPDLDVKDWTELNPALAMAMSWMDLWGGIIIAIFLLALSFGIINTMLMAVLERIHELGMLSAIGMSKQNIFNMIMLETFFLTLLGSIAGIIVGIALILFFMNSGIDLSFFMQDQFEDYGFASFVYPVLDLKMLVQSIILVFLTGILSAIYPARKALKMKVIEAIRKI